MSSVPPAAPVAVSATQPAKVDVQQLSKDHSEAVRQIKEIQVLVTSFLDTILVRRNDEAEKETQVIKSTIQQVLAIQQKLDKLGNQYAKLRLNDICPLPWGNTGYVILDPSEEQSGFHKQLIQCYTWLKNLDSDCTRALGLLELNVLGGSNGKQIWKRSDQSLQDIVASVIASHKDLVINNQMLKSENCLEIKLGNVFAVRLFFSGTYITHSIVLSSNEVLMLQPWENSEHLVHQKLSDIFNSVILRLIDKEPDMMLEQFLNFLSSYKCIFNVKCKACNKHLSAESGNFQLLPPLWKDFDSQFFYHLSCK